MVRNSSRIARRVLLQLHIQQLDSVAMAAGAGGKAMSELKNTHAQSIQQAPLMILN